MSNFSLNSPFLHQSPASPPDFEAFLKERNLPPTLSSQMQALGLEDEQEQRRTGLTTDRFIPSRKASKFQMFYHNEENENPKGVAMETEGQFGVIQGYKSNNEPESQSALMDLYKNQVLGLQNYPSSIEKFKNKNLLRFSEDENQIDPLHQHKFVRNGLSYYESLLSCTNLIFRENSPSTSDKKPMRRIPKTPFKILDAPNLQDDYYLNLIDWSGQDVLAVALGSCVYLWSAVNNKVSKLCELSEQVTSVAWSPKGYFLSVGVNDGEIQIWDSVKAKKVNIYYIFLRKYGRGRREIRWGRVIKGNLLLFII